MHPLISIFPLDSINMLSRTFLYARILCHLFFFYFRRPTELICLPYLFPNAHNQHTENNHQMAIIIFYWTQRGHETYKVCAEKYYENKSLPMSSNRNRAAMEVPLSSEIRGVIPFSTVKNGLAVVYHPILKPLGYSFFPLLLKNSWECFNRKVKICLPVLLVTKFGYIQHLKTNTKVEPPRWNCLQEKWWQPSKGVFADFTVRQVLSNSHKTPQ